MTDSPTQTIAAALRASCARRQSPTTGAARATIINILQVSGKCFPTLTIIFKLIFVYFSSFDVLIRNSKFDFTLEVTPLPEQWYYTHLYKGSR